MRPSAPPASWWENLDDLDEVAEATLLMRLQHQNKNQALTGASPLRRGPSTLRARSKSEGRLFVAKRRYGPAGPAAAGDDEDDDDDVEAEEEDDEEEEDEDEEEEQQQQQPKAKRLRTVEPTPADKLAGQPSHFVKVRARARGSRAQLCRQPASPSARHDRRFSCARQFDGKVLRKTYIELLNLSLSRLAHTSVTLWSDHTM